MWGVHDLEGAPIPIPGQRLRDTPPLVWSFHPLSPACNSFHRGARHCRLPIFCSLPPLVNPLVILAPAMSTSPGLCSARVVICILIQWHLPSRMLATVDIATMPAVMSPLPQTETFLAHWRVAYGGYRVQLPVRPVGKPGYGGKIVGGYGGH